MRNLVDIALAIVVVLVLVLFPSGRRPESGGRADGLRPRRR